MSTGTAGTLTTARIPLSPRVPLGIELEYSDNPFLIVLHLSDHFPIDTFPSGPLLVAGALWLPPHITFP